MDGAMEWYYAVPLLFTALAVVLASVFVKLRSSAGDKGAEAAPKDGGDGEPRGVPEAAKASAAADRADGGAAGETIPAGQEEEEKEEERDGGEGPPASEGHDERVRAEAGRVLEGDAGAEEGKKAAGDKSEQPRAGEEEEDAAAAASRTAKAAPQSPSPEMKVRSQAAAAAAASALEGEEQEEDDEDDEEEEDEEESKEEDQESETEKLVVREPESENVDEQFSFKYSPGKLRGNQYKTLLTKEELEEEQRTEDYMKLSLDSS